MNDPDGLSWILYRINMLTELNSPRRPITHRNIWQGCYDVWSCEQDRIDAVEIPKLRMQEAEAAGLIKSETFDRVNYKETIWSLTELGKTQLTERTCKSIS